jgi:hypothetical protein
MQMKACSGSADLLSNLKTTERATIIIIKTKRLNLDHQFWIAITYFSCLHIT